MRRPPMEEGRIITFYFLEYDRKHMAFFVYFTKVTRVGYLCVKYLDYYVEEKIGF